MRGTDRSEMWAALADRYELVRSLGGGLRTEAFLVRDATAREVVLKVPRSDLVPGANDRQRFLRELGATSRLKHPNILPVLDFGEAAETIYYCVPFVSGGSLADRLARREPIDVAESMRISREIGDALDYAHGFGIVHRGLEPTQILFDGDRPLVREFGISRLLRVVEGDGRLTSAGMMVGTPLYMSPEELGGQQIDGRSDVYALALLTVVMVTGRLPYEGRSVMEILKAKMLSALSADDLPPGIPSGMKGPILRALATDRVDRFASTLDFVEALIGAGPPPARLAPPARAARSAAPAAALYAAPSARARVTTRSRVADATVVVIIVAFVVPLLTILMDEEANAPVLAPLLFLALAAALVLASVRIRRLFAPAAPDAPARSAPSVSGPLVVAHERDRVEPARVDRPARRERWRRNQADRLREALAFQYELVRPVGAGGMAEVYLARDLRYRDRTVAIKVMRPEHIESDITERFLDEIDIVAALSHPSILPLLDSGDVEGRPYFVMPFVEGESLRDRLGREGPLAERDGVGIASQVARALDYAHRHGVVHRDVKPENILLQEGRALLTDFGIALTLDKMVDNRRTHGNSIGTPPYMSPEQFWDTDNIGPATDQYSLGCVICELLTGDPPYLGNFNELSSRHLHDPIPRLRDRRQEIPTSVDDLVTRLLQKKADDRFPSMELVVRELESIERDGAISSRVMA